jgi:hypothetical protein
MVPKIRGIVPNIYLFRGPGSGDRALVTAKCAMGVSFSTSSSNEY